MALSGVRTLIALAIPGLVLLSGCATADAAGPGVGAAESSTPTPEMAAPLATTLTVSATGLTVLDQTSEVMADIPFSTAADVAAAQLADVLGAAPSVTDRAEGNCLRGGTIYNFEGFALDSTGTITVQPAAFSVIVTAPTTTGGVRLVGPAGSQVGQPLTHVIAAIPEADDLGLGWLVLQNIGTADDPAGVGGDFFDDAGYGTDSLTGILSPIHLAGEC